MAIDRHVIGNWKMNIPADGVENFVRDLRGVRWSDACRLSIAPPYPFIAEARDRAAELRLPLSFAAQNCSDHASGAYTGEVSASMIALAGGSMVIVGHSERREIYGEDDELVGLKLRAAVEAGLIPVLCVGESMEIRERDGVAGFLEQQLVRALGGLSFSERNLLIAYEPIWAIGTGRNASGDMVAETAGWIRRTLASMRPGLDELPLLYGGSVTEMNARELMREADVDGFLVGGASLEPEKVKAIYEACASGR